MVRPAVLTIVILLLIPISAGGASTQLSPPDQPNQIEILSIGGLSKADRMQGSLDISTSLTVQHERGASYIDQYALLLRLEQLRDASSRENLVVGYAAEANGKIATLWERRTTARQLYRDGSIDAQTYLRELALISAKASHLRLSPAIADRLDPSYVSRIDRRIETRIIGLQGPVKATVLDAFRGDRQPATIFLKSSPNGTVLAMLDDGTYIREAYRADYRTLGESQRIGVTELFDEVVPQYYAGIRNRSTSSQVQQYSGRDLVTVMFQLSGGSVEIYFDSDTRQPFYEIQQYQDPAAFDPDAPTVSASNDGLRLTVRRTIAGGPLKISTISNETDRPVPSTVIIDGDRIMTNEDGVVWTLFPPEPQLTIRAVGPGGPVSVKVRPIPTT